LREQLLECLRDGRHLIRSHSRPGQRHHAADRGDSLGLSLERHQVERRFVVAARAPEHQDGRADALELA